jgi:hypothetical protein
VPREIRIRQILKNPYYAGALAYGRTEVKLTVEEGRGRKASSRRHKPREKWKVLILDNHVGYITWEVYLENQAMLESNAAPRDPTGTGAAKKGPALLTGLLRCGHCGRKLFVSYGGKDGRSPRYGCHGGREERGSAACQSLGGMAVDRAVSHIVLEAIQPTGVQAAIDALAEFEGQQDTKRKSLELALEKARYEVDRARRQYDAVDPGNRLVAGELEQRWNAALERVAELERESSQCEEQRTRLTAEEQTRLLELGNDLPLLWNHESASPDLKKRILRTVLEQIVIRDDESRRKHLLVLHWKGGVHTELEVARNKTGHKSIDTDKTALELIEELSKVCSDHAIAATLNRLGYKTGAGKTWRVHRVHNARYVHRLTNYRQQNKWLTVESASIELGVSITVIRRLIRKKTLPATQMVANAPWIICREALSLPAVQADVTAVRSGRRLRRHDTNQQELSFK